jgi:hypothetical protein
LRALVARSLVTDARLVASSILVEGG